MDCPFGTLYAITEFGQLSKEVEVDCDAATEFIGTSESAFSFYPPDCDYNRFTQAAKDVANAKFDAQCKGKKSCDFLF